jgi:hypothetical protein
MEQSGRFCLKPSIEWLQATSIAEIKLFADETTRPILYGGQHRVGRQCETTFLYDDATSAYWIGLGEGDGRDTQGILKIPQKDTIVYNI